MIRAWSAALLVSTLALAACSRAESATPAPAVATTATHARAAVGTKPRLVFFMNPNGRPCQMQDQILREMGPALTSAADVVYYRTTDPADLAQFEAFGIRSLPQLVVTDPAGRELRRATPGIQGAAQVQQLLAF